jgi:hypothetical protein
MCQQIVGRDRILLLLLIASFILCIHGMSIKFLHPDQMAFIPLFHPGEIPFNPKWFEKPPFHAYFNYFLSVVPVSAVGAAFELSPSLTETMKRAWSNVLTAFLFLGSVGLVFQITRKAFGSSAAGAVTALFASSAGLIAHSHFLTADVPVMFWMLVAAFFSQRIAAGGGPSSYACAGFFIGIAAATKYNGLAVGVAMAIGHCLAPRAASTVAWKWFFGSRRLLLGLAMVIVGFLAGNPFAVLDYPTFKADFLYNYLVAPVYEGQTGHSYWKFFRAMFELAGIPAFAILSMGVAVTALDLLSRRSQHVERSTVLLCLAVFAIYFIKFGSFPRLETRFVLPIIPYCFIMAAGFWTKLKRFQPAGALLLASVLAYNVVCSFYVGRRFVDDPRSSAELWIKQNVSRASILESDIYSPAWQIHGVKLIDQRMPFVTGRERLFERLFRGNSLVLGSGDIAKTDAMVAWYSLEALRKRDPDILAVDSLYYQRFTERGIRRELYPSIAAYFEDLLDERYPYKIVFDQASRPMPIWTYPREIDFQSNRITILTRKDLRAENVPIPQD